MSIQTAVYEGGQWTTRDVNIHDIIGRARQTERTRTQASDAGPAEPTPIVGLLSKTIVRSPVINRIIPGRIRDKDKNDIIFIGEDFIHIKEVDADAHLTHIATKDDFRSRIRAARVFGEPRMPILDVKKAQDESVVKTEPEDDAMDIDRPATIPPQVLVLTLESNEIMFLFAHEEPDGGIVFMHSGLPMPQGTSQLDQPGRHLAVDPLSRAIAVAACENTVIIYSTKKMDDVRQEFMEDSTAWSPIREERPVRIDGAVLHMEFLYPAQDDENHVILLVIYATETKTRMNCYDWDNAKGLRSAEVRAHRQPLSKEERFPSLLIPLQFSSDFMVIGTREVYLYKNILSGVPSKTAMSITQNEPPRFPGSSPHFPRWTSWCRMVRNFRLKGKNEENFYLIREDGVANYIRINPEQSTTISPAAHFNCSVDTAFARLDVGWSLDKPDVLIAGGDFCYGQVCKIGSWKNEHKPGRSRTDVLNAVHIESIPNWAPTLDLMISDLPGLATSPGNGRESIYTTSGRYPFGAISELRWGVQARVGITIPEQELADITGVWALFDGTGEGIFFLMSFAEQSTLIRITAESEVQFDFSDQSCGVDVDRQTLAAASLDLRSVVQVTEQAITVLDSTSTDAVLKRSAALELPSGTTIVAADIRPPLPVVVVALRREGQVSVQVVQIRGGDTTSIKPVGESYSLDTDLTSLSLVNLKDPSLPPLICIGTADGRVLILSLDPERRQLYLVRSYSVNQQATQDPGYVCNSVTVLANSSHNTHCLVCGLRNGSMYSIPIDLASLTSAPSTQTTDHQGKLIPIGQTPVHVYSSPDRDDIAFFTCGPETCRLTYGGHKTGLNIHNIWFTDRKEPAFKQPTLHSLSQIPLDFPFERHLICISGSCFMIAHIEDTVEVVPRRVPLDDTPYKFLYSKILRLMVVAALRTRERPNDPGYREVRSVIYFTNPLDDDIEDQKYPHVKGEFKLNHGERVVSMVEWVWEDPAKGKYVFMILGTSTATPSPVSDKSGRLIFLRITKDQGRIRATVTKTKDFAAPVYAIAPYGDRRIVYAAGKLVVVDEFSPVEGKYKWQRLCDHKLSSPAVYISTVPPFIHVSTAEDSLLTLELSHTHSADGSDELIHHLDPYCSDSQARQLLHHLPVALPNSPHTLLLATDKSATLVGLLQPPRKLHRIATTTLFEAHLPRSIIRLRRGQVRPPWRLAGRPPRGVLLDDLLGTSADGAAFAFALLAPPAWRLLRLLANLLRAQGLLDPPLPTSASPRRGLRPRLELRDVEPGRDLPALADGSAYCVDGDLLAGLAAERGPDALRRVLDGVETDVRARFAELARELLGDGEGHADGGVAGTERDGDTETVDAELLDGVCAWLREVLAEVL